MKLMPGVEHRVEDLAGRARVDVAERPLAAPQLHRAVSELRDLEAGAAQGRGGELSHIRLRAVDRAVSCPGSGRYRPVPWPATVAARDGRRTA